MRAGPKASTTRARRCVRRSRPASRSWSRCAWHQGWPSSNVAPLLAPDIRRIGHPGTEPYPDRAPDSIAAGTPEPLRSDLVGLLGADRVLTRPIDLIRYASDASPYRLIPRAVVMSRTTGDIAKVFEYARRTGTPVVLRGGGTSLNGQGQTDGILVDVRRHWRGVRCSTTAIACACGLG